MLKFNRLEKSQLQRRRNACVTPEPTSVTEANLTGFAAFWHFLGGNADATIALAALFLGIGAYYLQQRHNKLSVRPYLCKDVDTDVATGTYRIWIRNNGLGPAWIKTFRVLKGAVEVGGGGERRPDDPFGSQVRLVPCASYSYGSIDPGSAILQGASIAVLDLKLDGTRIAAADIPKKIHEVHALFSDYDFVIEYQSAYKQSEKLDTRSVPEP
jgi:hypothetical protein